MRTANLANSAIRQAEVGQVWREKVLDGTAATEDVTITAGTASFEVRTTGCIRVSAAADVGVDLDGFRAVTLRAGEVEIINVGFGLAGDNKRSVTVEISNAASSRVQVAEEKAPGSRTQ